MSRRTKRAPEPKGKITGKITKADIEAKLREAVGEIDEDVGHGHRLMPWALGAGAVIVLTYRLGLRRGTRQSTMLEIRRIASG